MSLDPRAVGIADRIDDLDRRIERLETLEFGTVAFPSATGAICDTTVTVAAASVTCVIPTGMRHLIAIISAGLDTTGSTIAKIRVTLNGAAVGYQYVTRQENPFVVGDTQAVAQGGATSAAFMETLRPAHRQTNPSTQFARSSGMFFFPRPDVVPFRTRADIANTAVWIGSGRPHSTAPQQGRLRAGDDLGTGFKWTAVTRISSITWTAPPATTFIPGSRFTVYAL